MHVFLERIKNKKTVAIICLISGILLTGYTFTDEAPYLLCNVTFQTTPSGWTNPQKIYFPTNRQGDIYYDEEAHLLINTSSSSIFAYQNLLTGNNGQGEGFSFQSYQKPYISHRGTTYDVTRIDVLENHGVKFYTRFSSDMTTYIAVAILFILFFLLFKR